MRLRLSAAFWSDGSRARAFFHASIASGVRPVVARMTPGAVGVGGAAGSPEAQRSLGVRVPGVGPLLEDRGIGAGRLGGPARGGRVVPGGRQRLDLDEPLRVVGVGVFLAPGRGPAADVAK